MRYPKDHTEKTRQRILATAGRLFKERGYTWREFARRYLSRRHPDDAAGGCPLPMGVLAGLALAVLASSAALAVDHPIPGRATVVKQATLAKFVSKSKPIAPATFPVPAPGGASDPTINGAQLRFFDTGSTGGAGDVTFDLDASGWRALGNPPGATGDKDRGSDAVPPDPTCKTVLIKDTTIKARCTGAGVPLDPMFLGAEGIILGIPSATAGAALRYCAEFGGTTQKNDDTTMKRKDAPVPGACSVALPTSCADHDPTVGPPPAFPGAQGGGAASVGGRGGAVIEVTNLNDSGAGSLRACITASGPRTCVFRVGGTINLLSGLYVANPYLTVAGQTAPGGGILISGKNITSTVGSAGNVIVLSTDNVIWRYTRSRSGYRPACAPTTTECGATFAMYNSRAIMVDHNSVSWNSDEGISAWGDAGVLVNDITISSNLVAEGLENHSTGYTIGGANPDAATNIDLHHNLTMNNTHRNPYLLNRSSRIVNNLFYNQAFHVNQVGGGIRVDIIGNLYKQGPLYGQAPTAPTFHEIQAYGAAGRPDDAAGDPSIYVSANVGWHQPTSAGDQWLLAQETPGQNGSEIGPVPLAWRRTTPLANTTYPIIAESVSSVEGSILPTVGASRGLDCNGDWVANRDTVDLRLITQYETNTGNDFIVANESEVGGFPTIASGTPCADADHDGMPDAWETAQGLNPGLQDNNGDADGDGFTNLEEYLNGTCTTPPAP